eukprot:g1164.t1 g1164   contig10:1517111-1521355(-)
MPSSAQIGPLRQVSQDIEDGGTPESTNTKSSRSSVKVMLSSKIRLSSLNIDKFDQALSPDFASSFEESEDCFHELTVKAATLLGAERCFLFVKDAKEQNLYTFLKDGNGNKTRATKPLDRGITGSILSESSGYITSKATQSTRWSQELDELPNFVTTSYLAWPIWDFTACRSIGVVEFRNKGNGLASFNAADSQFARIIALQLGHAVINYKQQELIAGHTETINQVYEKNFDQNETINIYSNVENGSTTIRFDQSDDQGEGGKSRAAFTLSKQPSLFTVRRSSVAVCDRAWDYDVFLKSEEELMMHAIDIFDERGLFSRFSIPMTTFVNFVNEIKNGYDGTAPYHNSYHAFDVMHVCYLLMTKCRADEYLESFNILSILVGALAHDLGHDGYNNAFHLNTESDLSVTYNGISILENYSAAYLFRILRKQKNNIFARLNADEMTKMRTRLIDMILDTDAKNHFMLMTRFKHGLEMKKLSRGLLSSMILHVSDVSNPARPGSVARKWAYAVQTEFFRQGDKEKEIGLPPSPFMDREFENLPRMQVAFIDAVVHPVFRLLADFLPLVEDHCIKSLQLNRAFWHNMMHRGILKTGDIISFLDAQKSNGSFIMPSIDYQDDNDSDQSEDDNIGDTPIPGIPADATQSDKDARDIRRTSVISIYSTQTNDKDPELGEKLEGRGSYDVPRRRSLQQSVVESSQGAFRILNVGMQKLLHSPGFQFLTFFATIYALFAFDLNLAVGSKAADVAIDFTTFGVFVIFIVELILSLSCVPGYIQFFFWLDFVATISLYFEIGFLVQMGSDLGLGAANELALAKAGRAAKAGARAGRLASILRLIRLVKIFKLAKWTFGRAMKRDKQSAETEDDLEKDLHFSMSIIGRRMTESITKKVIIAVVLMLIMFSSTDVDYTPDARQIQLDSIAEHADSTLLRDSFFESHNNIIAFSGAGFDFVDQDRFDDLRDSEILTLTSDIDASTTASFDISEDTVTQAWYSLLITTFVSLLLATMGLLFSRDAYKMVIHPIEKMKSTVQHLSENPLLHLERIKKRDNSESNETDMLEQAITKMAALLQVGFGSAGAEIIAKNLGDMGELDPMIPGVRVNAIFGFCDIRDFTFATEGLQQDVMIFVNKIADITHRHVAESGGHPNKNIGDAFLLVWKLKSGKNTNSSGDLQKELFDAALICMQNIIKELRQAGSLGSFLKDDMKDINPAWASSLESYSVAMGVGLHKGWAIEGAIGSKVKIDASYLSPHVNLASRLETATKQYNVPLLMSDAFFGGLSGSIQSTCRRCDKVSFIGSTDPMVIYHQDVEPLDTLKTLPPNHDDLIELTSWDEATEHDYNGLIKDARSKLESETELVQREVFDALFNSYIDRDWHRCKIFCHLWMKRFPSDPIVVGLVNMLAKQDFKCPISWPGYHVLMEK